jgi:hypothetical protein
VQYLIAGEVGPTFIEDGEPVSSKVKKSPLSFPLIDVSEAVHREGGTEGVDGSDGGDSPPPTLVVAELISQMVKEGSEAYQTPELSDDVVQRLNRCYNKYATHPSSNGKVMNKDDVEKWLIDINQQVGRGSEFRTAAKEMGWKEPETTDVDEDGNGNNEKKKEKPRIFIPEDGILTLDGFVNVYEGELRGGKFWGIAYDLAIMGEMLPSVGTFKARYDRMYCSKSLVPTTVLDTTATIPCPNNIEPSDHLPVAASFEFVGLN